MAISGSSGRSVVVSVNVDRTADEAWRALTERERLRMWFGTPSGSLTAGGTVRIDFGDGDFFVVEPRTADPARLVEFDWRFLGVGPVSHVRWEVRPTPDGSQVTVRDDADERDQDAVRELTEGWQDFLGRLGRYLDTGRNTRYECRAEIDGAIDLPAAGHELLGESRLAEWLPIVTDEQERRWFQVPGPGAPRRFEIGDWRSQGTDLHFTVRIQDAVAPTPASVRVRRIPHGTRLSFSHSGWNDLGLEQEHARDLRTRFATAWISALDQAGQVTQTTKTGAR